MIAARVIRRSRDLPLRHRSEPARFHRQRLFQAENAPAAYREVLALIGGRAGDDPAHDQDRVVGGIALGPEPLPIGKGHVVGLPGELAERFDPRVLEPRVPTQKGDARPLRPRDLRRLPTTPSAKPAEGTRWRRMRSVAAANP